MVKTMILGGVAGLVAALAVMAGLVLILNALDVYLAPDVCFLIGLPVGAGLTLVGEYIALERWGS